MNASGEGCINEKGQNCARGNREEIRKKGYAIVACKIVMCEALPDMVELKNN